MPVAYRDSTSGTWQNSSSPTITLPTHQAGDLLLLFLFSTADVSAVSAGWDYALMGELNVANRRLNQVVKVAASAAETAPTVTIGASTDDGAWACLSISGAETTYCPFGGADLDYMDGGTTTTYQMTNAYNCYGSAAGECLGVHVLGWSGVTGNVTQTTDNGWSERADTAVTECGIYASTKMVVAGAVTMPALSFTSRDHEGFVFYIPAAGVVPAQQKFTRYTAADTNSSGTVTLRGMHLCNSHRDYDYLFSVFSGHSADIFATSSPMASPALTWRWVGSLKDRKIAAAYAKLDTKVSSGSSILDPGVNQDVLFAGYLRGAHPTTPFARVSRQANASAVTTHNISVLTTTHSSQLHLILAGSDTVATSATPPTGYTEVTDANNAGSPTTLFAFTKRYGSANTETSPTTFTTSSATPSSVLSLLIAPADAAAGTLPAAIRAFGYGETSSTNFIYAYGLGMEAGEIMVVAAIARDVATALDAAITTTPSLTWTDLYSLYDTTNEWNINVAVALATADTADVVTYAPVTDCGSDMTFLFFIVSNANTEFVGVDVAQNDAGATSIQVGSNLRKSANAAGAAIVISSAATGTATPTTDDKWEFTDYYAFDAAGTLGRFFLLNHGDMAAGGALETFTVGTSGDLFALMLLFNQTAGGSGLFFGQNF